MNGVFLGGSIDAHLDQKTNINKTIKKHSKILSVAKNSFKDLHPYTTA